MLGEFINGRGNDAAVGGSRRLMVVEVMAVLHHQPFALALDEESLDVVHVPNLTSCARHNS